MEELRTFLNDNKDKIKITNMATDVGWQPAPLSMWLQGKLGMPKKHLKPVLGWLKKHGEEMRKFADEWS